MLLARHENHSLKDQLSKTKKKHSCEEVQKLKNLNAGGDLKLEKQIETLYFFYLFRKAI